MSYEDEVIPSPRYPQERRINLYEGSASSASTHEAWKYHCKSTQEKECVFANQVGGQGNQESEHVRSGMVQIHDSYGAARGAGLYRESVREGASWDRVFWRLAGIHQGNVSLVLSCVSIWD